ncbi:MAG TPA: DUF6089 family protein [Cyclobacteriaceae bacterium]|jgi:hypothetical protein|nr:DUF6089 family protein [Cyclobacteriaceae bacterium]
MNRLLVLTFSLATIPFITDAQSFYAIRRDRSLIFSAGTGTSSYFGELKDKGKVIGPNPRVNLNFGLQYFFTNRIAVRTEVGWFQLAGNDASSVNKGRNLSFTSNCYEINAVGMVNLFPNGTRFYQRAPYNIYAFAGVGYLHMNPKAEYDGKKYALQPLRTENVKYSREQFVIPFGLGARIKVTPFFNVAVEGGWRVTFTDYIDDVSTRYPDRSTWDPNSIRYKLTDRRSEIGLEDWPAGHKRGNPSKNDSYYLLTVKVEYYLPNNFIFGNNNSRKLYNQKRKSWSKRGRRR